jgi:hypothetical protein
MAGGSITKGEAKNLIRQTVLEFRERVMIPLHNNRDGFIRAGDTRRLKLIDRCPAFLNAAGNLEAVSDSILELDASQITQLLCLCRDVSRQYDLPVHARIPEAEVGEADAASEESVTPAKLPFVVGLEPVGDRVKIIWRLDNGAGANASPNTFFDFDNEAALEEWLRGLVEAARIPLRPQVDIVYDNLRSAWFINEDVFDFLGAAGSYRHLRNMIRERSNAMMGSYGHITGRGIDEILLELAEPIIGPIQTRAMQTLEPIGEDIRQRVLRVWNRIVARNDSSEGQNNDFEGSNLHDEQGGDNALERRHISSQQSGMSFRATTGVAAALPTAAANAAERLFNGEPLFGNGTIIEGEASIGMTIDSEPFIVSVKVSNEWAINSGGFNRGRLEINFSFLWRFFSRRRGR